MKKLSSVILLLLFVSLFTACKKETDKQTVPPPEPPPPGLTLPKGVSSKDITITLPANTPVDLATCEVFSLSLRSAVNKEGKSNLAFNKSNPNIAYVFDKNDNLIVAGFITDSTTTISIGSTAEVLLYYGIGVTFQPYEIMEKFINGFGKVPGVAEWKTELEGMFKNDPLMLQKGLYANALKTKVEAIIKTGVILRRPADITVDANDTRSGLQLAEKGFNQFTITNTSRRRSQAFIYKMNYKNLDGNLHVIHDKISGTMTSISDLKISPTGAIRDFKGVLQDWVAGKGPQFAATTNGPVEIPLEDNEIEANFKVRVVGPGKHVSTPFTTYETERFKNLALQTVAFDYLIPVLLDAVGHKEMLGDINAKLDIGKKFGSMEAFLKKTSVLIASIPAAADAMEEGNYGKAFTETMFGIINGKAGSAADELIQILYDNVIIAVKEKGGENLEDRAEAFSKRGQKLLKVLQVIDMGMKAVDYSRMTAHILSSNSLEEWDLKAKEVQLNLSPKDFTIGILEQKLLTAQIKTALGTDVPVIEYQWETTGKYGYLWDDRGHKGKAFSSSIKEAFYLCNARESEIESGKEYSDTIKVTAYLKVGQTSSKIGSSLSIARISRDVFSLGWTPNVNITKITAPDGKVTYNSANPYFTTEFAERKNAKYYSIGIIRKDGTKATATNYLPSQLTIENGIVKYRLGIGGLNAKIGMSESDMLVEKARQEKMLNDYVGNGIEVTVKY